MMTDGVVYGIDQVQELVDWARENVMSVSPELIESGRLTFVTGDGRRGLLEYSPFDIIHVGAASPEVPTPLVDQVLILITARVLLKMSPIIVPCFIFCIARHSWLLEADLSYPLAQNGEISTWR